MPNGLRARQARATVKLKQSEVDEAAAALCESRLAGQRIGPLPATVRPKTISDAYAVQAALRRRLAGSGRGSPAGYKIGCTTRVMQEYLEIDQPCAGTMYASLVSVGSIELELAAYARLGVECEIAVRLASALAPADAPHDEGMVKAAIAAWMPSLEIVEDRYEDYPSLGAPTLIADDFFHAACVVGPDAPPEAAAEIGAAVGRLEIDGAEAGRGTGRDILGDPERALVWLANHLASRGETLPAGAIVTLGSVVKTVWIDRPCMVAADFPMLGRAEATFV